MLLEKPVKAGEQIWNTYGTILPNHMLLHSYGFLAEGNEVAKPPRVTPCNPV